MERRYISLKIGDQFISRHFSEDSFVPSFSEIFTVLRFKTSYNKENNTLLIEVITRGDQDPKGINRKIPAVYANINNETGDIVINSVRIEKRRVSPVNGYRRIFLKLND
jgi:hypothetical protein